MCALCVRAVMLEHRLVVRTQRVSFGDYLLACVMLVFLKVATHANARIVRDTGCSGDGYPPSIQYLPIPSRAQDFCGRPIF